MTAGRRCEASLGGDDKIVEATTPAPPFADDLFRDTLAVDIRRIDEGPTVLDEEIQLIEGVGLVGFCAECHGSQSEVRDLRSSTAQSLGAKR